MPEPLQFDRQSAVRFAVSKESRTIKGLAVPFGVVGNNGFGSYRFAKGTLDWSKVKYLDQHNWDQAVGTVSFVETDQGLEMTAKISKGPRGDQILALTEPDPDTGEAVYDGLSIGLANDARFEQDDDGVFNCISATVQEVSGTPIPAFSTAQVTSVAASAVPTERSPQMGDNPASEATTAPAEALDFSAVTDAITQGFQSLASIPPREAPQGQTFDQVKEPAPYRFDGVMGAHDFSQDLCRAIRFGDGDARQRLDEFFSGLSFAATDSGDVGVLNPNGFRPDLWVGPAPVKTPVADTILRGGLTNGTPFVVPTFASSSGMVNEHTEGVEPDDGVYTASSLTVTPSALSGKVEITREVIDAGGSPQVSGIMWSEILRQWDLAKENAAAGVLLGSNAAELGTAMAGTETDTDLDQALTAKLAELAFSDYTFTTAIGHTGLYQRLVAAKDGDGRRLYPILNPTNAGGSTTSRYQSVNVGGYDFIPAGSLGASGMNNKSYIFDPSGVAFWMSAPQRIALPDTVATTGNLGLFGYKAGAVLDAQRVKKITFASA